MENKDKIASIGTIAASLGSLVVAVVKELAGKSEYGSILNILFWVAVGVAGAFLIATIILAIISYRKSKDLTSTTSVLIRSKKVANQLMSVISTVDKTIEKYRRKHQNSLQVLKGEKKEVESDVLALAGKNKKKKEIETLSFLKAIEVSKTKGNIKALDPDASHILELNDAVLTSIHEIGRALLVLEQYNMRIKLGDYILAHSSEPLERAEALIDYRGWTYSLLGKTNKFKENVEAGIELLKEYQKADMSEQQQFDVAIQLARAYRHLGSDFYTSKHDYKAAKEANDMGLSLLPKSAIPGDEKGSKKLLEMRVGLEYGKLNAEFYHLQKEKENKTRKENVSLCLGFIAQVRALAKEAEHFSNPHRYLKLMMLENEFIKILRDVLDEETMKANEETLTSLFEGDKGIIENIDKTFDDNTSIADSVFNRSIYADEMMELYIHQESVQLFRVLKGITSK